MLTHTHTHPLTLSRVYTQTHFCSHTRTLAHTHTCTHRLTNTYTHSLSCTHTHSSTHTDTQTHIHTLTHTHSCTHMHTHTHACTLKNEPREQLHGQIVSNLQPTFSKERKGTNTKEEEKKCSFVLLHDKKKNLLFSDFCFF